MLVFIFISILICSFFVAYSYHKQTLQKNCIHTALLEAECTQLKNYTSTLQASLSEKEHSLDVLQKEHTTLQAIHQEQVKNFSEKQKLLETATDNLTKTFQNLSLDALQKNNQSFLEIAKPHFEHLHTIAKEDLEKRQLAITQTLNPIKETLHQFKEHVQSIETLRLTAYTSITEQIKSLLSTQLKLESETHHLVQALRTPQVRGQWGEMHLRRTVELAGMINHVDFIEQASTQTDDGRQRPDMLIQLPNRNHIVVDAKAPLEGYLNALSAQDPIHTKKHLQTHARHIKDHITLLSSKQYWKQFSFTPEFVILFLPSEAFFSAALEQDPMLIEYGTHNKVLLATPTTLIALLKATAYGWQQETLAQEAHTISALGSELYERVATFSDHFLDLRRNLERTVIAFNKTLVSTETRLLPTARKLHTIHQSSTKKSIESIPQIDTLPTSPQAPELASI